MSCICQTMKISLKSQSLWPSLMLYSRSIWDVSPTKLFTLENRSEWDHTVTGNKSQREDCCISELNKTLRCYSGPCICHKPNGKNDFNGSFSNSKWNGNIRAMEISREHSLKCLYTDDIPEDGMMNVLLKMLEDKEITIDNTSVKTTTALSTRKKRTDKCKHKSES